MRSEIYLTLNDFIYFWKRKQNIFVTLFIAAFIGSFLFFLFFTSPKYIANSTFQDGAIDSSEDQLKFLEKMMKAPSSNHQKGRAIMWMSSYPLLEKVIEKQALRLSWGKGKGANFLRQLGGKKEKQQQKVLESISNLKADRQLEDELQFLVREPNLLEMCMAGEKKEFVIPGHCSTSSISFDVCSTLPKGLKLNLKVNSLDSTVVKMKKRLNIDKSEVDPNVILLTFSHLTPVIAKNSLDCLMREYQALLTKDLKEKVATQVDHLSKRQLELFSQYNMAMREHVGQFEKNIQSHGVMTTNDWLAQKGELEKTLKDKLKIIDDQIEVYSEYKLNKNAPLLTQVKEDELGMLYKERQFLSGKLDEISMERAKLPEQWMSESLLQIKSDLNSSTLEALSQLVESTTIKQHLKHIDARPMEWGFSNMKRYSFSILTKSLLFSSSITFLVAMVLIFIQFIKGFPISYQTLKESGAICFPKLVPNIALAIEEGKMIAIFHSNDLDVSTQIASYFPDEEIEVIESDRLSKVKRKKGFDRTIYGYNLSAKDDCARFAPNMFDKVIYVVTNETSADLRPLIAAKGSIFVYI
ncbi:MAG: hypothetical protein P0S95_05195 [Rhabdochlamydiaceae bacterium]|nr:hypothetical protein [Candidatus Amphrikana amoebophyrae]